MWCAVTAWELTYRRFASFKASHAHKGEMEMVFVSSDSDSHAFDEYFGEMKLFHAIEYTDKTARVSTAAAAFIYAHILPLTAGPG